MYFGFMSQDQYEAYLVSGMKAPGKPTQYELFKYLRGYFWEHYRRVFFPAVDDVTAQEIYQNTTIKLWENIERNLLSVSDNRIVGRDSKPLKGSLRTYFMGIAKFKYLEYAKSFPITVKPFEEGIKNNNKKNGNDEIELVGYEGESREEVMWDIVADCISKMKSPCYEIMLKTYFDQKTLDSILLEMPSFKSKDALKTKKYKCNEQLRAAANSMYEEYLKLNA